MNRRRFMAVVGGTVTVAVGGSAGAMYLVGGNKDNNDEENGTKNRSEVKDPPEEVVNSEPLAKAFYRNITSHFDGVHVYIRRDGDIVMEYQSSAEGEDGLDTEMHQIALVFADLVKDNDYDAKSLSIVVGEVQYVAPRPTVSEYADGEINKEAYLETIGVTTVERRNNTDEN